MGIRRPRDSGSPCASPPTLPVPGRGDVQLAGEGSDERADVGGDVWRDRQLTAEPCDHHAGVRRAELLACLGRVPIP